MAEDDGFLSRWSRRKVQGQQGLAVPPEPTAAEVVEQPVPQAVAPSPVVVPTDEPAPEPPAPPPPTLAEAQALTTADDFTRFIGRNVDPQVRNTALTTLFSDPHFNVMDGLDTYIGDYNTPDPLPPGMLRKMVQSTLLGLFDDEKPAAAPPTEDPAPHEDLAVRLQPNDDAGPAGDQPGPGEDTGREH